MQVYVLEGRLPYEGGVPLGVYSSREAAEAAARADMRLMSGGGTMGYVVHAIEVDAPADMRILVDEADYVGAPA